MLASTESRSLRCTARSVAVHSCSLRLDRSIPNCPKNDGHVNVICAEDTLFVVGDDADDGCEDKLFVIGDAAADGCEDTLYFVVDAADDGCDVLLELVVCVRRVLIS